MFCNDFTAATSWGQKVTRYKYCYASSLNKNPTHHLWHQPWRAVCITVTETIIFAEAQQHYVSRLAIDMLWRYLPRAAKTLVCQMNKLPICFFFQAGFQWPSSPTFNAAIRCLTRQRVATFLVTRLRQLARPLTPKIYVPYEWGAFLKRGTNKLSNNRRVISKNIVATKRHFTKHTLPYFLRSIY